MPRADCTLSFNRYGWHNLGPPVVAKWNGVPTLVQRCTSQWRGRKGAMTCTYYCPAPTPAATPNESFGATGVPTDVDPDLRAAEALARMADQPPRQPVAQPAAAVARAPKRRASSPAESSKLEKAARIDGHGMYRVTGTRPIWQDYMHLPDDQFLRAMQDMLGPSMATWPEEVQREATARILYVSRRNQPAPPVYGPEYKDYTTIRPSEDWQHNANFDMEWQADPWGENGQWPDAAASWNESMHHGRRDILRHMGVGSSNLQGGVLSDTARAYADSAIRDVATMMAPGYIPPVAVQGVGTWVTAGTLGPNIHFDDLPMAPHAGAPQ